jgi:hypothetical protein
MEIEISSDQLARIRVGDVYWQVDRWFPYTSDYINYTCDEIPFLLASRRVEFRISS